MKQGMTGHRASHWGLGIAVAAAIAAVLAPAASAQPPAGCAGWEIEYTLSGNLQLTETPLKQGDGTYPVGPGRAVLRFGDRDGQPAGKAAMLSYSLREHFTVKSKTLLWTTTVVTDAQSRGTGDAGGSAAEGSLKGNSLEWSGPVRGYRTDGTINCDGSLCGKFGAPPSGTSPLHIGPGPVEFKPFQFGKDLKSFTMASTYVSKTDVPKQTSHLSLAGREARRTCVPASAP